MATVKLDPAKGIQIPNLTTTERNAISSPETGAIIWNTTTSEINQYNGSAWEITYTDTNTQIAGITSSADATAITIDSSENVGIGTTSPSNKLQVKSSGADTYIYYGQTSDGANGFGVYEESDTSCSIFARNASATLTTAIRNNGGASFFNGGGNVGIANNAPAKPLDVTGDIRTSTGILFGTDTAAANALDDYEEGTWTPSGTNVRGTSVGRYTKIGNMCWLQGWIHVEAAGSTNNYIEGLPFTSAATGNANGGGTPIWLQDNITGLYVVGSATKFNLYGGSSRTAFTPLSASNQMHFVLQYITT